MLGDAWALGDAWEMLERKSLLRGCLGDAFGMLGDAGGFLGGAWWDAWEDAMDTTGN
jgi:hypothetical protein